MNLSKFNISISESVKVLNDIGLFKSKGIKEVGSVSSKFFEIIHTNNYKNIYDCAIENFDYDLLLTDDSIFQFNYDRRSGCLLRYFFIQNPQNYISHKEYLEYYFGRENLISLSNTEISNLISEINETEFEQFQNEQELNINSNIIRYDLNYKDYSPLIHPCSHIHIGMNENVRIPCNKVLTPLNFVFLCLKFSYYPEWKENVLKKRKFVERLKKCKADCFGVSNKYWNDFDRTDLFLT